MGGCTGRARALCGLCVRVYPFYGGLCQVYLMPYSNDRQVSNVLKNMSAAHGGVMTTISGPWEINYMYGSSRSCTASESLIYFLEDAVSLFPRSICDEGTAGIAP